MVTLLSYMVFLSLVFPVKLTLFLYQNPVHPYLTKSVESAISVLKSLASLLSKLYITKIASYCKEKNAMPAN
jgi:hypothetical protein